MAEVQSPSHYHCLPGGALVGSWSQEAEPGIKPRDCRMGDSTSAGLLTTAPCTRPQEMPGLCDPPVASNCWHLPFSTGPGRSCLCCPHHQRHGLKTSNGSPLPSARRSSLLGLFLAWLPVPHDVFSPRKHPLAPGHPPVSPHGPEQSQSSWLGCCVSAGLTMPSPGSEAPQWGCRGWWGNAYVCIPYPKLAAESRPPSPECCCPHLVHCAPTVCLAPR